MIEGITNGSRPAAKWFSLLSSDNSCRNYSTYRVEIHRTYYGIKRVPIHAEFNTLSGTKKKIPPVCIGGLHSDI